MIHTKRFLSTAVLSLSIAGAVAAFSVDASAHGGFPRAFQIVFEPGNPDDVVLRSDLWGFYRTRDGGKSWTWTCGEVYGADSLAVNHSAVALAPGGRMLVANSFKGLVYSDDGCSWTVAPDFGGKLVADVQVTEGGVFALTSTNTNTDAGVEGHVWKSTDLGSHFQKLGAAFPTNIAASTFGIAPSDSNRMYVFGRVLEATPGTLLRSDDGGASWKTSEVPTTDGFMTLRLAAIHPTRPDLVFLWGDLREELMQDSPDEIWASPDGGATWKKLFTGSGDLPGFAISPDGTQILVAGPRDGLMLATIDAALAQGQAAFSQDFTTPTRPTAKDRQVWGLHWDQSGLTAGLDNFTARGIPAFTYGAWSEQDKTFDELMTICDAKYGTCAQGSDVQKRCDKVYDDPAGGYLQDYVHSSRCVGKPDGGAGTGRDAGAPAPAAPKDSGGCAVPGAPAGDASAASTWVLGAFLAGLGLRRRRLSRS